LNRSRAGLLLLCLALVTLSLRLIPLIGLQADEVLFAAPLFNRLFAYHRVFHDHLPTMVMSYVGALKTWLWAPIFWLAPPSVWSIRLPAVLLAALTLWLCFEILAKAGWPRLGLFTVALSAADPLYLLTATFDWGPVVLQRLCFVLTASGILLWVRGHGPRYLYAAALAAGLGVWDKALFGFMLLACGLSALAVWGRLILRRFHLRQALIAAAFFFLGCFPLLQFNWHRSWETLAARKGFEPVRPKLQRLASDFNGAAFFGYLVREDAPGERSGPIHTWFPPFLLVSAASLPLLRDSTLRRTAVFCLLAIALWLTLVLPQKDLGGSAHHTALLLPLPHLLVAAFLTQLSVAGRSGFFAATALCLTLFTSQAAVIEHVRRNAARYGPGPYWTDAIFPLAHTVQQLNPPLLRALDWGIAEQLVTLTRGRIPVFYDFDLNNAKQHRETVYAAHIGEFIVNRDILTRMEAELAQAQLRKQTLAVIHDRNGRAVYELFRVQPAPAP
jgi:4-amino-4-deoxy-L-arabinose transferase-like glycosyltransferase